jgi:uncharacterized protein (TIGR00730 family)
MATKVRLDALREVGANLGMAIVRNICVYCGSSLGNDPRFGEAADQLGSAIAAAGIGLVFGGGDAGLMGRVARSVLAGGGRVTGIIPKFLIRRESVLLDTPDLIVVDDMHQRKQLMFDRADAFVALPGGIGTLEELVEQLTWVQLARHQKPVLLADIGGFWRPLLSLIAHMHNLGFLREGFDVHYLVAEKIEDVVPMLTAAAARAAAVAS